MEFKYERNNKLYKELCDSYPDCKKMWELFVSLTEIPRPSGHPEKVIEWAKAVGGKLGGSVKVDSVGNVCIAFPATKGKESLPGIVLQAHTDMVPTKTPEHKINFAEDPIVPYIDGDKIRATNTTLGADDGSGVAAVLAIAADKELAHGPLEILLTTDEEIGLVGALKLKEGELLSTKAKYLINVDSEDWGEITLSCAGGVDRLLSIPVVRAPHEDGWAHFELVLSDFKGGHSGVEIHVGRANAVKWAVEMLAENRAAGCCPVRLSRIEGGNAHNAIPSLVTVEFSVPGDKAGCFIPAMSNVFNALSVQYSCIEKTADKEPRMSIRRLDKPGAAQSLTYSSSRTVLRFLQSIHHGVWKWSEEVSTLVETSQSLSVVKLGAASSALEAEVFARSSKNDALRGLGRLLEAHAALYGGTATPKCDDAPGWPAEPNSHLCKTAVRIFSETFGEEPKLVPIHAGLECGIIINKFPANKLEAISIGPTVKNPHTVDEYMELPTAVSLYKYLHRLVAALSA